MGQDKVCCSDLCQSPCEPSPAAGSLGEPGQGYALPEPWLPRELEQ